MGSPPDFNTTVDIDSVDLTIDAQDLEDAGWIYVGDTDEHASGVGVLELVHRWHNDTHLGAFRHCTEEPCRSIYSRVSEVGA